MASWLFAVSVLVGVGGEFPLSDDWAYAHAARSLCEGRGLDLLPWTGASLLFQAAYGALACAVAGFSYETLRLTTVAMSLVGIGATYALLREVGAGERVAATGAAVLAFSPVWMNLSLTFMTDVPFAALATLAAALYARGLRRGRRGPLVVASIVAAAAFLVRQHGVFAPAAAVAALLASTPLAEVRVHARTGRAVVAGWRSKAVDVACAAAVPLLVVAAYTAWVLAGRGVPLAVQIKVNEAATTPVLEIGNAAFRGIATTGLMLLPWALALRTHGRMETRGFGALFALLSCLGVFLFVREGALLPYLPNVLWDLGLGAVTLRDAFFLARPVLPSAGPALMAPLTAAALASAAMLGVALTARTVPMLRSPVAAFCLGALGLTALGTLGQSAYYFDRYLLAVLPLAMAGTVVVAREVRIGPASLAALVGAAAWAVAGTHDYLEWNRARWRLLDALEARGVAAERIDGGMEYNAERLAARLRTAPTDAEARRGQAASVKSWWWVVDDEWVVAFSPLEGYSVRAEDPYPRWLPPGEGRVLLLERDRAAAARREAAHGRGNPEAASQAARASEWKPRASVAKVAPDGEESHATRTDR